MKLFFGLNTAKYRLFQIIPLQVVRGKHTLCMHRQFLDRLERN